MKYYISKEGLEKLKNELYSLKNVKRKEIIERIRNAKELGDLSENAEYAEAKDEQSFIEGKILEIENFINKAVIIDENSRSSDTVTVGTTVKIQCEGEKNHKEYTIVGSNEANPREGKISNESPFGKAFLGKKIGEKVEVQIPKGKIICEIMEIVNR